MRSILVEKRKSRGFSQYSFAAAIGISRSYYAQIENGTRSPSLKVAIAIKNALSHDSDDIFLVSDDANCVASNATAP